MLGKDIKRSVKDGAKDSVWYSAMSNVQQRAWSSVWYGSSNNIWVTVRLSVEDSIKWGQI